MSNERELTRDEMRCVEETIPAVAAIEKAIVRVEWQKLASLCDRALAYGHQSTRGSGLQRLTGDVRAAMMHMLRNVRIFDATVSSLDASRRQCAHCGNVITSHGGDA